jgi:triacylglycerol lipase
MPTVLRSSFGLDAARAERLLEMGMAIDPAIIAGSRALFADRLDLEMPEGGARHYDVAYGDDPRQKLDICATYGHRRPVVLFVPGGGFARGDKSLYLHVPTFFAREDFVGVVMNYRLAPDFEWPEAARDVAAALDWIADRIGDCGGDPERIAVLAHSAGAAHAAAALFDGRFQPRRFASVRAVALLSGLYRIDPGAPASGVTAYFGEDPATFDDRSPLGAAARCTLPIVVASAELDPPSFTRQAEALVEKLAESGNTPLVLHLERHNHVSPVMALGSRGDLLGKVLAEEFRRHL